MKDFTALCLASERLLLKSISLDYKQDIFAEFTPDITEYMYPKPAENLRETERFIKDAIQQCKRGTDLTFVILKREGDRDERAKSRDRTHNKSENLNFLGLDFLGVCSVHRIHTDTPELGIWIKKSAHGHGYGREAIHCLKAWIDQHLDYEYLVYPVDKRNSPSQKIPIRLGGHPVREFEKLNLSGKMLYLIEYRIHKR